MITDTLRLPGVFFEAPTPAPEEGLPRMDIAAFVGFAAAGPLHVPVAVESPRRFRDLFGADPELAWNDERGELRRAHLGGAVEAFFANGGLRAWVVRVADRSTAVRHAFALPGLIAAADRQTTVPALAQARARAAGSWCEELAVGTALSRDLLPLRNDDSGVVVTLAPRGYQIDLAVDRSRVRAGDLFELTFGPGTPTLLLFADQILSTPGGVRIVSAAEVDAAGETAGVFWTLRAASGSPTLPDEADETTPPIALGESAGIAMAELAGGSQLRPVVRRLSFEVLVWRGTELHRQLSDLAFGARHPRFWATLPTDDELFRLPLGAGAAEEPQGLAREVSSPRFPLVGPSGALTPYYLPWGMGRPRVPDRAIGLPRDATSTSTALERDGLAQFDTGLFVDDRLAPIGVGSLLGEAEHRLYVAGLPLAGLHCLLPITEASIVAVPDAVHRGWSRELPPQTVPIGAPDLHEIPPTDAADRYPLTWTSVVGAEGYTVERDFDPAFANAVAVFDGEPSTAAVTIPPACPREIFFRVRAFRGGEIGPWSNTRGARLPREAFAACGGGPPPGLVLAFTGDHASPGPALEWTTEDPALPLPDDWQIEEATDPGFATATLVVPDGTVAGHAPLAARRVAAHFYRIRGVRDGVYGPWSNTVRVGATERATFTERSAREYDASVLLALHRAMLRFAAARGDLLAVLSMPDHYRAADALEHTGRLTPGGVDAEPAPTPASARSPRVPPLTAGETSVLSFGALYHPWTLARTGSEADLPLRLLPPDGAVAGLMADLALREGAWRAPANRPLVGIVGLEPPVGAGSWGQLVTGGVNALLNEARGFLTLSEDTLGGERALGRVHVRRLMILLRRLALREGERLVFEPHGPQLRRRVQHLFERVLGELFQRGAFAGADAASAFHVVTDESINTPATVDRGRLIVELRVTPAAALANLTVRLVTAGSARLAIEEV